MRAASSSSPCGKPGRICVISRSRAPKRRPLRPLLPPCAKAESLASSPPAVRKSCQLCVLSRGRTPKRRALRRLRQPCAKLRALRRLRQPCAKAASFASSPAAVRQSCELCVVSASRAPKQRERVNRLLQPRRSRRICVLPVSGRPVILWESRDEAWVEAVQELERVAEEIGQRPRVRWLSSQWSAVLVRFTADRATCGARHPLAARSQCGRRRDRGTAVVGWRSARLRQGDDPVEADGEGIHRVALAPVRPRPQATRQVNRR